jgi:Domain of unknown function (DUF4279)
MFVMAYDEETYDEETVYVKLLISHFECEPEQITKILGLSPHRTWIKGDKITPKSSRCYKFNGWWIATPQSSIQETSLEKQIDLLMSIVEPAIDSFKNLPENIEVEVGCHFYVNDPKRLVLGISNKAIQIMAKIDAYLDIDLM